MRTKVLGNVIVKKEIHGACYLHVMVWICKGPAHANV